MATRAHKLKAKLPKKLFFLLLLITAFNLIALFVRNILFENTIYNFLVWNLFLGFLPLLIAVGVYKVTNRPTSFLFIFGSFLWLLFYPNAPYMISDIIHVDKTNSRVIYNALLIFSFAMLSVFYGFYSLKIMHLLYTKLVSAKAATLLIGVTILLSSFGIYLGRILRLNSWDLFTNPFGVMRIVFDHLYPFDKNPITYVVIVLFSAIQFVLLIMMKDMDEVEQKHIINGLPVN